MICKLLDVRWVSRLVSRVCSRHGNTLTSRDWKAGEEKQVSEEDAHRTDTACRLIRKQSTQLRPASSSSTRSLLDFKSTHSLTHRTPQQRPEHFGKEALVVVREEKKDNSSNYGPEWGTDVDT